MRKSVKDRLNKRLVDNNMTQLSVAPAQQTPQRLYRNRTYDKSECENRLNSNEKYGNGLYDDRLQYNDDRLQYNDDRLPYNDDRLPYNDELYNEYSTLQDPIDETDSTLLESIAHGNEQLLIVAVAGIILYGMYLYSKSKE